jgi:hypothetical protein
MKNRDAGIEWVMGRASLWQIRKRRSTSGGLLGTPVKGSLKSSRVLEGWFGCDGPLCRLEKEVVAAAVDDAEAEAEAIAPAAALKEACKDGGWFILRGLMID